MESYWSEILIDSGKIIIPIMIFVLVIALFFRKYWNSPIIILFIYCVVTIILNLFEQSLFFIYELYPNLLQPFIDYWRLENTFFIQIFFYIKNFLLLSLFYGKIFPYPPFDKYIIILGKILTFIVLINYCFFEGYQELGVINPTINAVYMVILPLIYMWISRSYSLRIPLNKNPYFWISLGLLIPSLMSLFLYFSGDYVYQLRFSLYIQLELIKNLFEIIGQILIAIGFAHSYYARFIQIDP